MPRLILSVFCQQALVDTATNALSIINQYDELHPVLPEKVIAASKEKMLVAPIQCALVTVWERAKPEISEASAMSVELYGPSGKKLAQFGGEMDMRKFKRVRNIGNLPGLPVAGEGTYQFVVRVRSGTKWKRAGVVTYVLKFADANSTKVRRRLN